MKTEATRHVRALRHNSEVRSRVRSHFVAPVPVTNLQLFTSKNIELEAYVGLDACLEIDHHLFG